LANSITAWEYKRRYPLEQVSLRFSTEMVTAFQMVGYNFLRSNCVPCCLYTGCATFLNQ